MLIVRRSKLYCTASGIITPEGGRPEHGICVLLFFTLDAGLLARSQYSEGPATGYHDTGFSWFPCA